MNFDNNSQFNWWWYLLPNKSKIKWMPILILKMTIKKLSLIGIKNYLVCSSTSHDELNIWPFMVYNPVTRKVSPSCIYEPVFSQILCQSLQLLLAVQLEFEKSWSFVRSVWNPFSAVLHSKLEYLKKVQAADWLYNNDRIGKIKNYRKCFFSFEH